MINLEHTEVLGWESAIRGMRNPMNSWDKSDTIFNTDNFAIGANDLDLMKRLVKAGTDHRKFMRMIIVYVDVTAPLYWFKEFDTYKVGTVANSCSTMHKITDKKFTLDDFSCEHLMVSGTEILMRTVEVLNDCRNAYINYDNWDNEGFPKPLKKDIWWQMIQLLPSSYNQRRTVMLNYEVLANIYHSRKDHKLDEWHTFCHWIESLPYSEELIMTEC